MKMTKRILAVLIGIVLAGCGGGGGGGGTAAGDPPVLTGTFRDSVVKGIRYVATAPNGLVREGVTDDGGRYSYYEGGKIDFFVGQILLASVNNPTATTVTAFLAQEPVATNISRFLQTLDEDGDPSNGIVIPAAVLLNANGIGGGSLDFASAGFDAQFDSVKPALLANSSISGSIPLVSSSVANLHTENSARYALISSTRLGNALEGKLTYPESYNREVLSNDEFQRVRQYVWESLVRPKLDAAITLGSGKVDSIDGTHEIVQSTLNAANAALDLAAFGLSAKEILDKGAGFATQKRIYTSISSIEDVLGSACSVEAFIADDSEAINAQADPVKYIRDFSPNGSSALTVDAAPLCDIYGVAHGAIVAKDDPRADAVNGALSDIISRTEAGLLKSANRGWPLKNSFGHGVSLSPIDKAKYAIQAAQIVNDVQGAVALSLNTQEVTSLLVARIYLDTWVRSAGDRNFMGKLISGQTGNGALTTNRYEDIDALINFYSSTGVWCDIKTFFKGGLIVGVDDVLSGKRPNYVTCSANVDRDLINRTIDNAVSAMIAYLQVLKAKIGPFAQSSSATFDLPPSPTCIAPQVLANGLCVTPSVLSISPTTATVDVPVSFTVTGQHLPLTAVMSVVDANCGIPINRSASGFSVLCTPLGTGGSKAVTVKTDTQASGGIVIDASHSVAVSLQSTELPMVFSDDFNDGVLDPRWVTSGNTVYERNGYADLTAEVTDNVGYMNSSFTKELSKFRINMRHIMHAEPHSWGGDQWYSFPSIGFETTDGNGFSIIWQRSGWSEDNCGISGNYNKILLTFSGSRCFQASVVNSSDYYDKWIESVVEYDAATGLVSLDIGADGTVELQGTLPIERRLSVRKLGLSPYGWWTGHWHRIDQITVHGN